MNGKTIKKWIWKNGLNSLSEVYDGTWKDDKPDGKGEHVWIGTSDAFALTERQMCNRYVGEFQNGLRYGNDFSTCQWITISRSI